MRLYLLTRKEEIVRSTHEFRGFVICASSAEHARELAYRAEPSNDWLQADRSTLMVIGRPSGPLTESRIIMSERI